MSPAKGMVAEGMVTVSPAALSATNDAAERTPGLFALMREDAQAALARDPSADSLRDIVLFSTGTHAVWAHRRHHWLWQHGARTLALWLAKRMRRKLGVDIHPAARIGRRLTIDHGMGVVIGATSTIGDDCMIYQGVTLGMTGKQMGGKRHPDLGDNVLVGANATILGDIHVGDGAKVGAGAVVVRDVPAGATAVGVPAHVVRDRGQRVCKALELMPPVLKLAAPARGDDADWSCAL